MILVVDASSMATSVSALIMGYMHYDREVKIKGVILNKAGNKKTLCPFERMHNKRFRY